MLRFGPYKLGTIGTDLAAAAMAILACAASATRAGAQTRVLDYTVEHPRFGTIGTYTNRIERHGDVTRSRRRCAPGSISRASISNARRPIRAEHWYGSRLARFDGLTTTNGTPRHVHGEMQGDRFVILSPTGTATAPADIVAVNPWSGVSQRHDNVCRRYWKDRGEPHPRG